MGWPRAAPPPWGTGGVAAADVGGAAADVGRAAADGGRQRGSCRRRGTTGDEASSHLHLLFEFEEHAGEELEVELEVRGGFVKL
jgi:hypothetical protein